MMNRPLLRSGLALVVLIFAAIGPGLPANPGGAGADGPLVDVTQSVRDRVGMTGIAHVIVELRLPAGPYLPEGWLSTAAETLQQRADIRDTRARIQQRLAGVAHRVVRTYETVPLLALEVTPASLAELEAASLYVSRVVEDRLVVPTLLDSNPLVEAPQAYAAGYDGSGIAVAVLDTGVSSTHSFFGGRVVEEACYSGGSSGSSSFCPNGQKSQTGPGAAAPCPLPDCDHGTHVAGIAAGSGATAGQAFSGIAKSAQIIAVQVFSNFDGDAVASTSDVIAGLERVFQLRSKYSIASVNLSLGGGASTSICDTQPIKLPIDNLRSVGIATVIASGNDGFTNAISYPACVSTSVSVGSTTKTDAVSSFSNRAPFLSLFAPGSSIRSSVPGGSFGFKSGTSMATPHVAGAFALLRQATPASVSSILSALQQTGQPITSAGTTISRIRIGAALSLLLHLPVETPAASTWGLGRLDVFRRGLDGSLRHMWYDGHWSSWENLGGQLASEPAAVSWEDGRVDVFVRGTDNALWHRFYDHGWSGWESLGGYLAAGPAVASWGPGRLDVFVRGSDDGLWHRSFAGAWSAWEPLGGVLTAAPAAVSWGPGRIDVFVRGSDAGVWQRSFESSAGWSGWQSLGGVALGAPAVSSWTPGRLDLFVQGSDSKLWHRWFEGGWSGWETLGDFLQSAPSAVSWGPGRIDVFAGTAQNDVYHKFFAGSWSAAEALPGP